jgi:tetraacyldisaccharide 4'-kinase
MHGLARHWYRESPVSLALAPLGWLYCALAMLRRALYSIGVLRRVRLPVAVIVVGNITVGGTGKTPLVIWLARWLRQSGYRPGIVTRGYGGRAHEWPQEVHAASDPASVGDEPVVLARRAGCPVVADPDRVRAARSVLARGCDVVISDDGLQHYRLARDVEIAVLDGDRRLGNRRCLPAGPLREPAGRLATVDACVTNGAAQPGELAMQLVETRFRALDSDREWPVTAFGGRRAHAVAGIGNPQRFFHHLRRLGVDVIEHAFPDHHDFTGSDVAFSDDLPILMTEKDAVKCSSFAAARMAYLAVEARPDPRLGELVLGKLKEHSGGG